MKLVFAIKRLENMAGGAERVILQVIGGLHRKYDYDITLISFDDPRADSFYPVPEGIKWIKLGIGNSAKRAGFYETFKRILALRRYVLDHKPDIIIPFQHSMFVPMILSLADKKIPLIASEHIVPDHYTAHPLEYFLLVLTGLKCRKITVLSDNIIKMYPKCLWSRMVAVPNPVESSETLADVIGGNRKTLLSVGRLDPQKDQQTLIEAFSKLADEFPDWDLKIIGEGRLRPALEQQIKNLGLQQRVMLPGLTKSIMSEYQSAQAFVLASKYEAFGLATAEAMSAGLPVVGFEDCPGTNELIQHHQNGILVKTSAEISRSDALANALRGVLKDSALRQALGANGRDYTSQFSTDHIVAKWNELLLLKS